MNAATIMQSPYTKNSSSDVTKAAVEWGKARGVKLVVFITDTLIEGCKNFGVSADFGANVLLSKSILRKNTPCSFLIKGGTDAYITSSQFCYDGKKISSFFIKNNW